MGHLKGGGILKALMLHTAYIGIGSNLGDRLANCRKALSILGKHNAITLVKTSLFYESKAIGVNDDVSADPDYINAVALINTSVGPDELLNLLMEIEGSFGRLKAREKATPRAIDLDILFYDNAVISRPNLQIPHPKIQKRMFVLRPLCDIAPELSHPVLCRTIQELYYSIKGEAHGPVTVEVLHV